MDENGIAGLEEERRLAYVGITRARKNATIFFAANRLIYGSWASSLPSRFIDELPKDHVEVAAETGLYKGQQQMQQQSSFGGYGGGGFRGRPAQLIEAWDDPAPSVESERGFGPGDKVFHEKFGTGTVVTTDGNKLDIKFDKAGRKKVIDSFVRKAD
jgi:DNA helicase-2/ATP-dependent DNA helicase PcrA